MKKSETQVESHAAFYFFDGVSKAWLADLVTDLVRRNAGDESLDGTALVEAIVREAEPITRVRGDDRSIKAALASAHKGAAKDAAKAAQKENGS